MLLPTTSGPAILFFSFLGGIVNSADHELQIKVSIDPCRGKGNVKIALNLTDINVMILIKAIEMFKELFSSMNYKVEGLSFNLEHSSAEVMVSFVLPHHVDIIDRDTKFDLLHAHNESGD